MNAKERKLVRSHRWIAWLARVGAVVLFAISIGRFGTRLVANFEILWPPASALDIGLILVSTVILKLVPEDD